MNYLAIGFSIITLYWLVADFLVFDATQKNNLEDQKIKAFVAPKEPLNELVIEKEWIRARLERDEKEAKERIAQNNKQKPTKAKAKPTYPTLTVGGIDYRLMGIFKSKESTFILLKAPKNKVIKVIEGHEISPGIVLKKVSATKIILTRADETIEFKLFERNKNA